MTLYQLQKQVYGAYQNVYANWKGIDKLYNINCLRENSHYTFADDMVVYLMDKKNAKEQIDKYIKRMLGAHCKNNKQGYFEMILSTMLMANVFHEINMDDLSETCSGWYYKLFYNEETIKKFIKMDEIEEMWRLR